MMQRPQLNAFIARSPGVLRSSFCIVQIALACVGVLSNGCLVMTSEHLSKPAASDVRVQKNADRYFQHFDFHDFGLDVDARNSLTRWEAPFLFWVLPIPNYYDWRTTTLSVRVEIEPKADGVVVDPWQTYYIATNETRIAPVEIWQGSSGLGTNGPNSLAITNKTSFFMEYGFPSNPDIPFHLAIEGISVLGEKAPISVAFKPAQKTRLEFALPY